MSPIASCALLYGGPLSEAFYERKRHEGKHHT